MPPKRTPAAKQEATKTVYVTVTKDGAEIKVHPNQVEQHMRLGWVPKDEK